MNRKLRQTKRVLTSMAILAIAATSFFKPFPFSTAAQTKVLCPGNLIANGDFTAGLVGGQLGSSGAVSNWSKAYLTPDVGTTIGYADAGVVGMWGNMNPTIGEGLQQNLGSALVAGKTYTLSFYGRAIIASDKQNYAKFRVRLSGAPKTSWGTADTIGRSNSVLGTWTPISFTFMAVGNTPYLTVNVENDLSADDGTKTSYGQVDDFCLVEVPPDFPPTNGCAGKPVPFTSSANGATSWNWNFGDGTLNSNLQNPTHTFANPGTYNVTLCVNGATNCVTKPVVISAAPPVPVITGPTSSCGNQTATYSVPAVSGMTYSWMVNNGLINGSSTQNSVSVTWNPNGTGVIGVTVTNKAGCSSTIRMEVSGCNLYQGECCTDFKAKTDLKSLIDNGGGVYDLTATLSVNQSNITRVVADVVSTSLTYSPSSCGTAGPVNGYVLSAGNIPGFTASIVPANGHEVIWHGSGSTVSGIDFPIKIQLPPPPTNFRCHDYLTICVKYTITYGHCQTCEVIRCYGPFQRGGGIRDLKEITDIKAFEAVP